MGSGWLAPLREQVSVSPWWFRLVNDDAGSTLRRCWEAVGVGSRGCSCSPGSVPGPITLGLPTATCTGRGQARLRYGAETDLANAEAIDLLGDW